ncbi:hypothetical protein XENOCAPTIV_027995 [Xenoophorus captivus]|uniref:PH domain-containing protein n=1 Tax=Xenoophorus captivus TaxID=1517983 RepID=A0ABV0S9U1_9TELE
MEGQAGELHASEDVRKSGYLRKQKSMHRRYFVLRAASERGPARLEYYESEKKFRGKAPVPKKAVALETCFNINKRADSKNKHMIVLYTRAESFAVAAENEEDQHQWFQAMVELQCKSKPKTRSLKPHDHALGSREQCCHRTNGFLSPPFCCYKCRLSCINQPLVVKDKDAAAGCCVNSHACVQFCSCGMHCTGAVRGRTRPTVLCHTDSPCWCRDVEETRTLLQV